MKIKRRILISLLTIFILGFGIYLWDGFFSYVLPWTQTIFMKHESFIELLTDRNCFGGKAFEEKLPDGSKNAKYYWHQEANEIIAAYSVVLSEEEYVKNAEVRLNAHCVEMEKWNCTPTYIWQNEQEIYIDDTTWYDEQKLQFVDKLIERPKSNKQYYFLVFTEYSVFDKIYYSGVILNDDTHELIEFSVCLRNDITPCIRRMFWDYQYFVAETHHTSYCEEMPSSFHNPKYFVYKGAQIYKSGYRVAFSEEDYEKVKQERIEYYRTSSFDSEDNSVGDIFIYAADSKQYLDSQCIPSERIDYLDNLLTEEEKGQFYLGCSRLNDQKAHWPYRYDAVFFDDESCEMIEVSYYGPLNRVVDLSEEKMTFAEWILSVIVLFTPVILFLYVVFFVKNSPKKQAEN